MFWKLNFVSIFSIFSQSVTVCVVQSGQCYYSVINTVLLCFTCDKHSFNIFFFFKISTGIYPNNNIPLKIQPTKVSFYFIFIFSSLFSFVLMCLRAVPLRLNLLLNFIMLRNKSLRLSLYFVNTLFLWLCSLVVNTVKRNIPVYMPRSS